MRRSWIAVLFFSSVIFFCLVLQSIVAVRRLELRQLIHQERLLNYELSSQLLAQRLRYYFGAATEFDREVQQNVLQSHVMNNENESLHLSGFQRVALALTNGFRRILLKKPLRLEIDRFQFAQMKAAFLLERSSRFEAAGKLYAPLAEQLEDLSPEMQAFVGLHYGFCLVIQNKQSLGKKYLEHVRDEFTGTHYATTARLLLSYIEDPDLLKPENDPVMAARKGNCAMAIKQFDLVGAHNSAARMAWAGCLEKSGKIKEAVSLYDTLFLHDSDLEIRRRANRRLMLIAEFQDGGQDLAKYSQQRARQIGDAQALQSIQEARSFVREDRIKEELEAMQSDNKTGEIISTLIENEILSPSTETDLSAFVRAREAERIAEETRQRSIAQKTLHLRKLEQELARDAQQQFSQDASVRLEGGRVIGIAELKSQDSIASINTGSFSIDVPIQDVLEIRSKQPLHLETTDGTETSARLITKHGDHFLIDGIRRIDPEQIKRIQIIK